MSILPAIFTRRSLRLDILVAFGGLLLITVLVVVFYFYHSSTHVVLMLSDDLMEQTTQTVINRTVGFLTPVAAMTAMSSRLAANKGMPFSNPAGWDRYAIQALQTYPQIAMFLVGDHKGDFLLSCRQPNGTLATKFIRRSRGRRLTTWKYWDNDFRVIRTATNTTDTYDPRTRPWYQGAEQSRGLYLTNLYIFYTGEKPGITVSAPVLDSNGRVLGVIGSDIDLHGLSTFLKSLKIGKQGLAFILNEKNELVAFPDPSRMIDRQCGDQLLCTVKVEELQIPSITAAFKEHKLSGARRVAVEVGGQRYLAAFRNFPPSLGKDWQVGVVVPEADFIGTVEKINRNALLISLGILVIAALLVVLLARNISRPILLLAAETERIRNFQLDSQLQLHTHISEIQQLQTAIDRMKASLRSFSRFAPKRIVREVVVKGQETLLGGERREVTLLFSDLRNFTGFSERTKPEEVVQILNDHFDKMVQLINQHHGFVVDFLGDAVFAVFGAPERDPDHARNAVTCAIAMQLARRSLNEDHPRTRQPCIEMGIGINTGPCVVGNMGSPARIKYGVVGSAVNLASRLESFTVGGQVLISGATRQAVAGRFVLAGPLIALGKGMEAPIHLWEVRGVVGDAAKTLPPTVPGLTRLAEPLPVRLRLITGKQISYRAYEARLLQLSPAGAELLTELNLETFAPLQVEIPGHSGESFLVDAKVVGEEESSFIIRFTGMSATAAEAVQHWLA
jgi:adenylate cyclase|uniref:HAMP domain-containing protein n=1 Tax=Desulfobacca acetoxidans TaxID=60893 RepID=A0A7V6A3L0_9BACT